MSTEAQIIANRQNAQKSTGPRTPEGRTAVSQNAVTHGLTASQDVISSENQAEFDLYRDEMLAELSPAGPMESMLAERIVSLSWRLKRADRIQNQAIDAMHADATSNPLAKFAKSFFPKGFDQPQADPGNPLPDLSLGRLAIKDFSYARVLERLLMYERRMEHSLYRTMLELQRLRLMRRFDPPSAADEPRQGANENESPREVSRALTDEEPVRAEPAPAASDCRVIPAGESRPELCKTKPISLRAEIDAKSFVTKECTNKPCQRTSAKQSQSQPIEAKRPASGPKLEALSPKS